MQRPGVSTPTRWLNLGDRDREERTKEKRRRNSSAEEGDEWRKALRPDPHLQSTERNKNENEDQGGRLACCS